MKGLPFPDHRKLLSAVEIKGRMHPSRLSSWSYSYVPFELYYLAFKGRWAGPSSWFLVIHYV